MTYEEKLQKIVGKLKDERDLTRKGHKTKVAFDDRSFTKVRIGDICKILLKLQDDEGAIKIIDAFQPIETVATEQIISPSNNDNYEGVKVITIELDKEFDGWYGNYLLGQKSKLDKIDWINLLKIYDVTLDIEQQLQIINSTTIHIPCLPQMVRFQLLFPMDSIGTRRIYQDYRWEGVKYLANQGVVKDLKLIRDDLFEYGSIKLTVDLLSFNDFLKEIAKEYQRRNKVIEKTEKTKVITTRIGKTVKSKAVWPEDFKWEGKDFVFGKYGSICFKSEDRRFILKTLTDKKGDWATINELKGKKDAGYIRSTIKQIEDRLPEKAKGHITIISTQDDDSKEKPNMGAYRIRVLS